VRPVLTRSCRLLFGPAIERDSALGVNQLNAVLASCGGTLQEVITWVTAIDYLLLKRVLLSGVSHVPLAAASLLERLKTGAKIPPDNKCCQDEESCRDTYVV